MATSSLKPKELQDREEPECSDQETWVPGHHEVEYEGQESDLHEKRKACKKNPGHVEFISVSDFNIEHIPEGDRTHLWWDLIQTVVFLTVRLVVCYTSKERPDGYLDHRLGGRGCRRFGSGMVSEVYRKFSEIDCERCPCAECKSCPEKAKTQWGMFQVRTAKHVVYNKEECQHTTCDVWFDRDEDRNKCPKLEGVELRPGDTDWDICHMSCITHDENVCKKLEEMCQHYEELCGKLRDICSRPGYDEDRSKVPVVCISHPHGMSKHITTGVCTGQQEDPPFKWSYTTETCPGSSGAPVLSLGWWGLSTIVSAHSGSKQKGETENCHVGWVYQ